MLWIISGPSSAGKSAFITSKYCAELTGLPPTSPIVWPGKHSQLDELGSTDAFYHFNLLRALNKANDRNGDPAIQFAHLAFWSDLVKRDIPKKAVVLVCNEQTLMQRMGQRSFNEEPGSGSTDARKYAAQKWRKILAQVDLVALYQHWCDELRNNQIPYTLLDSNSYDYSVVDEDQLSVVVDGNAPAFNREKISEIFQNRKFGYQRVELPFGLHTRGRGRSETRDLILPESLAGKSVLDIGSALGYFCFEAEARSAARVVGVEVREDRFRDALLLKEIKGSTVEFIHRDFVLDPIREHFDYVLLLNVIHHLKEPFSAMRQLASITNERLIIEFPTLMDARFQDTLDLEIPPEYDQLPLVGVGSMCQGIGQSFVFTPAAIRRSLLDHERLFEDVEILPSPIPGRAIAICHKAEQRY
jgi:2-polyprenyl-3-methyl-5-hydroxy-6-metoxy-1,4-benzoquinol methylase